METIPVIVFGYRAAIPNYGIWAHQLDHWLCAGLISVVYHFPIWVEMTDDSLVHFLPRVREQEDTNQPENQRFGQVGA
jgi:hypothetical protein